MSKPRKYKLYVKNLLTGEQEKVATILNLVDAYLIESYYNTGLSEEGKKAYSYFIVLK